MADPGRVAARTPVHRVARMLVVVNGEPREAVAGCTLAQLLDALGVAGRIAVEVNDEVVPRSERAARHLRAGDRIEIVRAIGGG